MAFGQASGPPASRSQIAELLALLEEAGHSDFKDARYPMNFTQRQAGGKFTSDEAAEFIATLQAAESLEAEQPDNPAPAARVAPKRQAKPSAAEQALRRASDDQLAAELQRRGWIVLEP